MAGCGERTPRERVWISIDKAGVESLNNKKPIFVHTFAPSEKAGAAARQLYKRFGFIDDRECGKNPAGINIIRMKLNPEKSK